MKASKVNFKIENDDGTYFEYTTIMPQEIANKISHDLIAWKDKWSASFKSVEEFEKNKEEFIKKSK